MLNEIKRVWVAIVIFIVSTGIFISGLHEMLPSPLQLLDLKTMQATAGFLLAHVLRKTLLPKIDWASDENWQHTLMAVSLYVIIIYAFAMGG